MSARTLVILLVVALALPWAGALAPEPYAPSAASALLVNGSSALVSWMPGPELADSYRVYGFTPGGQGILLNETAEGISLTVPGGFAGYAVSGVKLGVESQLVHAITDKCVRISTDPPDVGVSECPVADKADAMGRVVLLRGLPFG